MKHDRWTHPARRRVLATLAAGAALALLSGCANSSSSDPSVLNVYNWGSADEAAIYDAAFDRFAEEHEGVTVNNSTVPVSSWGDYVSKLATQIAAGNSPDLLNMAIEGTQLSHERNLLQPLSDVVSQEEIDEQTADIPKELLDAFTVDGELYEIPNGWQTMVIYVNPELFAAKGVPLPDEDWTWDDFKAAATALTGDGVTGFGLPWGFFQLQPWFFSNDISLVTEDGEPNLTDPAVVESVTYVRDLVAAGVAPDPTSVDVYAQFAAGKYAMVGAGRWPIPAWSESGFSSYVPLPWPKQKSHTTVVGASGWAISSSAPDKKLAWEAIQAVTDPETVTEISDLGQQIPVYPGSATPTGDPSADDALKFLESRISVARPVPAPPYFDTLESTTMRYLEQIVTGTMSPEEGLQAAQSEIEAAIK